MAFPKRWIYLFPDGEYRLLCNQTYLAANVEIAGWEVEGMEGEE